MKIKNEKVDIKSETLLKRLFHLTAPFERKNIFNCDSEKCFLKQLFVVRWPKLYW